MYRVLLERAVERDLRRLTPPIHDRVIAVLLALAENPRPPGCCKLTGSKNDWRIRVGDYRVVYEIADVIPVVRKRFLVLATLASGSRPIRALTNLGYAATGAGTVQPRQLSPRFLSQRFLRPRAKVKRFPPAFVTVERPSAASLSRLRTRSASPQRAFYPFPACEKRT